MGVFHYDAEADAAYLLIHPDADVYKTVGSDSVILDFDSELRLIGIEILSPPADLVALFDTTEPSHA